MESDNHKLDRKQKIIAILCIAAGTGIGLVVYQLFLYFKIAIFGWNLGLIFAPLIAGYVETILANRLIGENLGAISAFILFIDTTFYSFILKNQTLGFNIITAGSVLVILQAAFPTLINYILLVVLGGILSNFVHSIKSFEKKAKNFIKKHQPFHWEGGGEEIEEEEPFPIFDETASNKKLNSQHFFYMTSTDMPSIKHTNIGIYQSEVIFEKDTSMLHSDLERNEAQNLVIFKSAKDECLIKLANQIKEAGGNGILDLTMNYSLTGKKDNIQITATGMGVLIEK